MLPSNVVLLPEVSPAALLQPTPFPAAPNPDLLELVTDGYLLLTQNFCISYASRKAERWLNQELFALLGEHYLQFFPKSVAKQLAFNERDLIELPVVCETRWLHSIFKTCLRLKLAPSNDGWVLSFQEEKNGLPSALQALFQESKSAGEELALSAESTTDAKFHQDIHRITDKPVTPDSTYQPLPNELRQLIYSAEEAERARIARELHDSLGQYVTAIRFGLENLAHEIDEYAEEVTALMKMRSLVEQFDQEFHYVALKLRHPALGSGLKAAIVQYALEWAERSGIHVDLHSFEGNVELNSDKENSLYRILQEALNNIQKYAKARRASVILENRQGQLQMIIEDDGVGFDIETYKRDQSRVRKIGLASMQERAALAGGACEIESDIGRGTTVIVRVPIK